MSVCIILFPCAGQFPTEKETSISCLRYVCWRWGVGMYVGGVAQDGCQHSGSQRGGDRSLEAPHQSSTGLFSFQWDFLAPTFMWTCCPSDRNCSWSTSLEVKSPVLGCCGARNTPAVGHHLNSSSYKLSHYFSIFSLIILGVAKVLAHHSLSML